MVITNRTFPVSPSSFIYPPVPPGVPVVVVSLCPGVPVVICVLVSRSVYTFVFELVFFLVFYLFLVFLVIPHDSNDCP